MPERALRPVINAAMAEATKPSSKLGAPWNTLLIWLDNMLPLLMSCHSIRANHRANTPAKANQKLDLADSLMTNAAKKPTMAQDHHGAKMPAK